MNGLKLNLLISIAIISFSCKENEPVTCGCLGFDQNENLKRVVCDDCETGISSTTCAEYNDIGYKGYHWKYQEGDVCMVSPPLLPDGGG